MDEQHGGAQQDAPLQDSPLRRLWTRLRSREQVRPTWRTFLPQLFAAPVLGIIEFMQLPLTNALKSTLVYEGSSLLVLLAIFIWPVFSLLKAMRLWLRFKSWSGAIWLVRPALLVFGFWIMTLMPIRWWGAVWDFERLLPERDHIVQQMLATYPETLDGKQLIVVPLPDGFRNLSWNGTVVIEQKLIGRSVEFWTYNGRVEYYTDTPTLLTERHKRYNDHWYFFAW